MDSLEEKPSRLSCETDSIFIIVKVLRVFNFQLLKSNRFVVIYFHSYILYLIN